MKTGLVVRLACGAAMLGALAVPSAPGIAAERGTAVQCRNHSAIRRIEVVPNPRPARACEVWYADTEKGWTNEIRWFAKDDRGFCHARADELIATLARKGWVCNVMRKRAVTEDSMPVIENRQDAETQNNVEAIPSLGRNQNAGELPALVVPRPPH